jgi:FKBP-type peptidyl-prolyl cis-trans isomerase 2
MAPVSGDTVRVHYVGTLADGTIFDTSEGRDPLEFVIGSGQVIPGFDTAVADLAVGETSTVNIPAADAYGEHSDEGLQTFPRDAFPPDANPEVGWAVELSAPDGQRVPATVAEVTDETITLDFNHPLAGQDLTFDITLVEVVEK